MGIFDVLRRKKKIPAPWEKYYTEEQLNVQIPNISMYDQLRISAKKYKDFDAIEYMGKNVPFPKLISIIEIVAKSFKEMGIVKGDIVTICLPNVPEALYALYALNKLGAIAAMVHPLSAEEEIKSAVNSTKSKYLIMMDMFYEKIENIIWSTDVEKVIFVSAADSLNPVVRTFYNLSQMGKFKRYPRNAKFISWQKFMRIGKKVKEIKYQRFGKNTPAVILHSGGTSGTPKNVVIQNRAFILICKQAKGVLTKLNAGDSAISILPNFHGFGLAITMHAPMILGVKTILIPKFDGTKFDTLFKKTRPTVILGVPTLFEALVNSNNEKNLDMSFLKYAISGGDILTKNLEERVNNYFEAHGSTAKITQGYGLTEALAAVVIGFHDVYKSGSAGIPLPGNYVKIIDQATRKTLPYGEIGEIVMHTKALMMGYLNQESETNEALQVHDDGYVWLHTGDLGYMDSDGFIFYKGRSKRMMITSGYNVYPSHVEEVIESHPAVLQCTVVGVPHPYKQEVGKAFIVLKPGFHGLLIKNEIKDYCKKNLAKYMVPATFVYRKQLPKTKIGKVDFRKLQSDIGADDDE